MLWGKRHYKIEVPLSGRKNYREDGDWSIPFTELDNFNIKEKRMDEIPYRKLNWMLWVIPKEPPMLFETQEEALFAGDNKLAFHYIVDYTVRPVCVTEREEDNNG